MDQGNSTELTGAGLVLFYLAQHPTASDEELAAMLVESQDTVQQLLASLVDNRLLARSPASGPVHHSSSSLLPAQGRLQRLLAVLREGALNEELQITGTGGVTWLFQCVWEQGADAMALLDPQGTILAANQAYLNLFGYAAEELEGKHFDILLPPDQRELERDAYQEVFTGELLASVFVPAMQRKDGSLFTVEAWAGFLTENYTRSALLCVVRDLTPIEPSIAFSDRVQEPQMILRKAQQQCALAVEVRQETSKLLATTQEIQRKTIQTWNAIRRSRGLDEQEEALVRLPARKFG